MLSTEQTKPVLCPRGRLLHQRGLTFSLAPQEEEEASRSGVGVLRWGCARPWTASLRVAAPALAVQQLFGSPSLGFRVNGGLHGPVPFLLRLPFDVSRVVELNRVSGARAASDPAGWFDSPGLSRSLLPPLPQAARSPRACQLRSGPGGPGCWAASPPVSALDYLRQISSPDF